MRVYIIILNVIITFMTIAAKEKFGNDEGDFNTPNILSAESSNLDYVLGTAAAANKWYAKNIDTEVLDGDSCFQGKCLRVYNRPLDTQKRWPNYQADIDSFEAGFKYMFNVMIKFTADIRSSSEQKIETLLMSKAKYVDPSQHNNKAAKYLQHEKIDFLLDGEWQLLSLVYDFTTLDKNDFSFVEFYIKVPNGVEYCLDSASQTKISYPNWKAEALESIDNIRKGTISVQLNGADCLDPDKVSVRVEQTRRHYPIGLAVEAEIVSGLDPNTAKVDKYRDWFLKRCTCATLVNAAKWKQMEWTEIDTDAKFADTDAAFNWLAAHGILLRVHADHWNKADNTPGWVALKTDKLAAIDRRTSYMANHFKDRCEHVDVVNECSNSWLYQDWTGIMDIEARIHQQHRDIDPNIKLFINEWGNLQDSFYFMETVRDARHLRSLGLIDGIGLQGHFESINGAIDMQVIRRRLEIFASLDIPIWITEHTIDDPDPVNRGVLLQDCMTMFFGIKEIDGLVLWNPAPKPGKKLFNTSLFDGETIINNAAGDAFDAQLTSWTTNEIIGPATSFPDTLSTSAFYGTYDVTVLCGNEECGAISGVKITPESPSLSLSVDMDVQDNVSQL